MFTGSTVQRAQSAHSHYSGTLDTPIYATSEYKGTNRNSNANKFEMFD